VLLAQLGLGPAPAAEPPRERLKEIAAPRQNTDARGPSEFVPSFESHRIWLAATNRLRAALGAMHGRPNAIWRLDSQDLPAQGISTALIKP
jgi:hypothetical protein